MLAQNRKLTVFLATSYLLAVTTCALFHNHHEHDGEQSRPGVSAAHASEDDDCSVCQFLAQKPAPVAVVAPVGVSTMVQDVAAPSPARVVRIVFTAWQSRAPPLSA
jgi:hypothetical protein